MFSRAADFKNSLYLSKGKTMTLYYVSSGVQQRDVLDATYYMAVIANEAKSKHFLFPSSISTDTDWRNVQNLMWSSIPRIGKIDTTLQ